jgi:uncharacterized membrane protein HdeD (DUF308 family)
MLGIAAIIVPMFSSFVIELFVGWLFLFDGSIRVMALVRVRHAPGFWWAAMTAALAVGLGVLLLLRPISGMFTLTIVLMIMFVADGVASIFTALDYRKHVSNWGLFMASGAVKTQGGDPHHWRAEGSVQALPSAFMSLAALDALHATTGGASGLRHG